MQRGVGEDRVEFAREPELRAVANARVETASARGVDHLGRSIHADHRRARGDDLLREHAVAASKIEDALAGLWIEQLEHGLSQGGYEMSVLGVAIRLPILRRRRRGRGA